MAADAQNIDKLWKANAEREKETKILQKEIVELTSVVSKLIERVAENGE